MGYIYRMELDHDGCYAAIQARDARFDGAFFTGVLSTGIFCRPVCPARTPRRDRVRFYPSAAAALDAGFRPCRRCRPDAAVGSPAWVGAAELVGRALQAIDRGGMDGGRSADDLARACGVSSRHLTRLFAQHVGSTPAQVATSRRVLLAHRLLLDTSLSIADVAFASGFGSVRQFNDVVRRQLGQPPSAIRRSRRPGRAPRQGPLSLRVAVRRPWHPEPLLAFLAARALPGLEVVTGGVYERRLSDGTVRVDLRSDPVTMTLDLEELSGLPAVLGSVRALLDTDAETTAIEDHLSLAVPELAPAIAANTGLRVPGPWDPWETAVRVVLGQQVSVSAATTLAGRLVTAAGGRFPTPSELAEGDLLSAVGMPERRKRAVQVVAQAVASGDVSLTGPIAPTRIALQRLDGIGPWTVEVIAMRALRDPDAFPHTDLGVRRALEHTGLLRLGAAEAASPWRSYLTMHLWEMTR